MALLSENELNEYVASLRSRIDSALNSAIESLDQHCPDRLRQAMAYSLLAPGKRLRPLLVLLAHEACGGVANTALAPAVAVEMIHCYSLIHDDLPAMDDDHLRRGRPTSHCQFDEATAILAGDALLTYAFEMLTQGLPDRFGTQCVFALAHAAGPSGMVGGQQDDVAYSGNPQKNRSPLFDLPQSSEDRNLLLQHIHERKTAALIFVSLEMGAIVANATPEQRAALKQFGYGYGLAFQITDDILDATGDEKLLGKKLHKDADAGKLTFVTQFGLDTSRQLAQLEIDKALFALNAFDPDLPAVQVLKSLAQKILSRQM